MSTSSNGWPARKDLPLRALVVAGEPFSPGILDNDDVFTVLQYVADQVHERVERIYAPGWHDADDWGFSFRDNRNDPSSLSNHASATAFDYNATRHPNGVPTLRTFTAAQVAEVHKILDEVDHCVDWGGDWNHPDAMHFEIAVGPDRLAVTARRLRNALEDDMPYTKDELFEIVTAAVNESTPAIVRAELAKIGDVKVDIGDGGAKRKLGAMLGAIAAKAKR